MSLGLFARRPRAVVPAVVAAAVLVLAGSPRAAADTVNLTFDKTVGPSVAVQYTVGSTTQTTTTPGPYYWHPSPPLNTAFPATTAAFCVELSQPISLGQTYTYDIKTVADAVGGANAAQFHKLWGAHFDAAWLSSSFAGSAASSAFQLALWELVYDGPGNLNLADGNFQVPGANLSDPATSAGLAKQWLDGLAGQPANIFDTNFAGQQLVWLSSPNDQDQLTMIPASVNPVPGPAGLLLGGLALGACGIARRRGRAAA